MLLIRKYFEETDKTRLEIIKEVLNEVCTEFNPSFNGENFEVSKIASQNGFKTDLDYYFELYKKWFNITTYSPGVKISKSLVFHMLNEIAKGSQSSSFECIITNEDIIVACVIKW